MRLAVQLDDDLRSHALLGLHAHARIFPVKEMDALKHVEERQAAASFDGAVGGNALGKKWQQKSDCSAAVVRAMLSTAS